VPRWLIGMMGLAHGPRKKSSAMTGPRHPTAWTGVEDQMKKYITGGMTLVTVAALSVAAWAGCLREAGHECYTNSAWVAASLLGPVFPSAGPS